MNHQNSSYRSLNTIKRQLWVNRILIFIILVAIGGHFHDQAWHQNLFLEINHSEILRLAPIDWGLITSLGETFFLIFILLSVITLSPQSIRALVIAAILGTLLSHGIKNFYDYPRPVAILEAQVTIIGKVLLNKSYVSGHTVTAFVGLGLIMQWLIPFKGQSVIKFLVLVLTCGIALSRIVVGAHWPLDILMGALVGLMAAYIATPIANWLEHVSLHYFLFLLFALVIYSFYYCLFYDHVNTASGTLLGKWIAVIGLLVALVFRKKDWLALIFPSKISQ